MAYVPGADFYPGGWGASGSRNALRLSFSFAEPRLARCGVEILADLIRESLEGRDTDQPACGCGADACDCETASCTEALVGVVGC